MLTRFDHKGGASDVNLADGKEVLACSVVVELTGDGREDEPALLAEAADDIPDDREG